MLLCYIKTIDICRIYTTWCKIRDKIQFLLFEVLELCDIQDMYNDFMCVVKNSWMHINKSSGVLIWQFFYSDSVECSPWQIVHLVYCHLNLLFLWKLQLSSRNFHKLCRISSYARHSRVTHSFVTGKVRQYRAGIIFFFSILSQPLIPFLVPPECLYINVMEHSTHLGMHVWIFPWA